MNIIVRSVDDPPVANDDEFVAPSGGVLTVAAAGVLLNDSDADEDLLEEVELVDGQGTLQGVLALSADGGFTYTPNAGFVGVDQFQYSVLAGGVRSSPATVTLRVEVSSCSFQPDVNGDGAVDLADVATIVGEFGSTDTTGVDVDCDGQVSLSDLIRVQVRLPIEMPPAPSAIVVAARRNAAVIAAFAIDSLAGSAIMLSAVPRQTSAAPSRTALARIARDTSVAARDATRRGDRLEASRLRSTRGDAAGRAPRVASGDSFDRW